MRHLVQLVVVVGFLGMTSAMASAQEVRLEGLSFYSEVSQRHVMAARVWTLPDEGQTAWAGARIDWKSLSLTPVLGALASGCERAALRAVAAY